MAQTVTWLVKCKNTMLLLRTTVIHVYVKWIIYFKKFSLTKFYVFIDCWSKFPRFFLKTQVNDRIDIFLFLSLHLRWIKYRGIFLPPAHYMIRIRVGKISLNVCLVSAVFVCVCVCVCVHENNDDKKKNIGHMNTKYSFENNDNSTHVLFTVVILHKQVCIHRVTRVWPTFSRRSGGSSGLHGQQRDAVPVVRVVQILREATTWSSTWLKTLGRAHRYCVVRCAQKGTKICEERRERQSRLVLCYIINFGRAK